MKTTPKEILELLGDLLFVAVEVALVCLYCKATPPQMSAECERLYAEMEETDLGR